MKDIKQKTLDLHKKNIGKLDLIPNVELNTKDDLSLAYTPGVAIPCMEIVKDPSKAYEYTAKGKTVAIVTDGTAVLGLGDIGPLAALPVMEGKSALLYKFSGIQAVPICLDTKNPDEIVKTVKYISPIYSGIMLEDIKAPECVYIENKLQEALDIPVFHDDQHGTAIVCGAALKNSLRLLNRKIENQKIVVCGTGAAGNAIIKTLDKMGAQNIYATNKKGVVSKVTIDREDPVVKDLLNKDIIKSPDQSVTSLKDVLIGADVFIGVSAKNIVTQEMVESMNKDSIVFAMANPDPEIHPDKALAGGAKIVGTGRSDFPNQINNVLVFPGLMKGVIEARAQSVTYDIKLAALEAIASLVTDEELSVEHILPSIFDERVAKTVCEAVIKAKK